MTKTNLKYLTSTRFLVLVEYLITRFISHVWVWEFKLSSKQGIKQEDCFFSSTNNDLRYGAIPKLTAYLILSAPSLNDCVFLLLGSLVQNKSLTFKHELLLKLLVTHFYTQQISAFLVSEFVILFIMVGCVWLEITVWDKFFS